MNQEMNDFLQQTWLGNPLQNYLWFVAILLAGLIFKKYFSRFLSLILFRLIKGVAGKTSAKDLNELLKKPFAFFLFLVIGYIAASQLDFPESWKTAPGEKFSVEIAVYILYKILLVVAVTWVFLRVVDFFGIIMLSRAALTESKLDDQLVPFFRDSIKVVLVIMSIFFMLATIFNVNVVTLIGGLGIGGLAVALAAKETLENLLGSFTIFLDKPFIVGDHVKVGEVAGHVESIGLRSTRIRTLEKSLVTVPNKKMVDAELENITERTLWRVKFSIGLLYGTSHSDMEQVIDEIRKYLETHESLNPDPLVRFDQFGASSLDILISYIAKTSEFAELMKIKEDINFRVMKIVRSHNTDFAFPSRSLYIEKSPTT